MGKSWFLVGTIGVMSKLTPKRRHFARLVASGQSQASAYREAFDCKPGSRNQTHVESASKLARDPLVSTTIRQLIDARDRAQRDRGLSHREIVTDRLLKAVDEDFSLNRLKALDLLATVSGMKKSSLDITQDNRSSESIMADLEAKLSALGLGETPNTGTVIDHHGATLNHDEVIESDEVADPDSILKDAIETDSTRH